MNRNIIPQNENGNQQNKPHVSSDVLKTTALQRLKEALIREEYEICAVLIRSAQKRGIDAVDIRSFLEDHVSEIKGPGRNARRLPRF